MIEIELRGKDGGPYVTEAHPAFVDYELREAGRSHETIVGIHADNLVAPIVAKLAGKNALSTYPELAKAASTIVGAAPGREDGARILALLAPWSRNFPDGLWVIAGSEHIPLDPPYLWTSTEPRYSARSLSIDPFRGGVTFIGDAEPMDDVEGIDLEPLDREDITIAEAMRRVRSNPDDKSCGSSGSSGRAKSTDGGAIFVDAPVDNAHLTREADRLDRMEKIEAGTYKPPTVGRKKGDPTKIARVKKTVAEAYAIDPEQFAALASAIANGTTYSYAPSRAANP